MTIKLNQNQLEGIGLLIDHLLFINNPENVAESLLQEIVFKIHEKITAKINRKKFDNRTGNNLSLTSIEAKAFYVWFNQTVISIDSDHWRYERIIGTDIVNQIDKTYA